jgi:hypothetical protein
MHAGERGSGPQTRTYGCIIIRCWPSMRMRSQPPEALPSGAKTIDRGSCMITATGGPRVTGAVSTRKPCPSGATMNCTGRLLTVACDRTSRSAPAIRAVPPASSDVVLRHGSKPATIVNARPRMTSTTTVSVSVKPPRAWRRDGTGLASAWPLSDDHSPDRRHRATHRRVGTIARRRFQCRFFAARRVDLQTLDDLLLDFRRLPGNGRPRCSGPFRQHATPVPRRGRSPRTDRRAARRRHPSSAVCRPARSHEIPRPAVRQPHR